MEIKWKFIDTGAHSGKYNMELDESLAESVAQGHHAPVLRFFEWTPYCISLGKNQAPEEIDLEYCRAEGIEVVKRPTGGRAVLHAEELTYSVIFSNEISGGVDASYEQISEALVNGFHAVDIDAKRVCVQPNFRSLYRESASAICFSNSAKSEIQIDGRKLVGSAQRRYAGAVLQHGSILIGKYHRKLADCLNLPEEKKKQMREVFDKKTIEISSISTVSVGDLKAAIKTSFERTFNIEWT